MRPHTTWWCTSNRQCTKWITNNILRTKRCIIINSWWLEHAQFMARGISTSRQLIWCRHKLMPMLLAVSYISSKWLKMLRVLKRKHIFISKHQLQDVWFMVHMESLQLVSHLFPICMVDTINKLHMVSIPVQLAIITFTTIRQIKNKRKSNQIWKLRAKLL